MTQIDQQYICSHRYCNFCKNFYQDQWDYYYRGTPVGRCIARQVSASDPFANLLLYSRDHVVQCSDVACDKFAISITAIYGDDKEQTMEDLKHNEKVTIELRTQHLLERLSQMCLGQFGEVKYGKS